MRIVTLPLGHEFYVRRNGAAYGKLKDGAYVM